MSQGHLRALNILLFIGAALVLVTAVLLEPDPSGVGTHQQLGLPPCVILSLFGIPCPLCGMTTSFALMADGDLAEAFQTQPFAAVLFLVTALSAIVSGLELAAPAHRWRLLLSCFKGREVGVLTAVFIAMIAAWAYKIAQNMIFLSAPA
jgi:hypothetical protein